MNANQISHYALDCSTGASSAVDYSAPADRNSSTQMSSKLASLEIEKTLFVMVSLLDLLMTSLLLRTGSFFETNPLADFFISGWGLVGMTGFKLVLVALILMVVNLIAIWRVSTARGILLFGSLFTGSIVVYSLSLWLGYHGIL